MLPLVLLFVIVIGAAGFTWWKDAKDGVNQGNK